MTTDPPPTSFTTKRKEKIYIFDYALGGGVGGRGVNSLTKFQVPDTYGLKVIKKRG